MAGKMDLEAIAKQVGDVPKKISKKPLIDSLLRVYLKVEDSKDPKQDYISLLTEGIYQSTINYTLREEYGMDEKSVKQWLSLTERMGEDGARIIEQACGISKKALVDSLKKAEKEGELHGLTISSIGAQIIGARVQKAQSKILAPLQKETKENADALSTYLVSKGLKHYEGSADVRGMFDEYLKLLSPQK